MKKSVCSWIFTISGIFGTVLFMLAFVIGVVALFRGTFPFPFYIALMALCCIPFAQPAAMFWAWDFPNFIEWIKKIGRKER
jgi:hypothetical protein